MSTTRTKTKSAFAVALVLPIVASLGVISPAPASGAVSRQLAYNGGFESGAAGWAASTRRTRLSVVSGGLGGSHAMKVAKVRRAGPAGLTGRSGTLRSNVRGAKYVVSAYVRTNQPGAVGTLALRETAGGQVALETRKSFRASRAWQKVALTALTRRAASQLEVRVTMNRLGKRKSLLVDGVSVVRVTTTSGGTTTPPPPMPPPTTGAGAKMSNGCAISARGIPVASCGALLGSAYGSNTDPTSWENTMGHRLGVHRTYYGATQVDKAVSVSKADLALDRIPWISFKLPYTWAEMAAGKGDAWTRGLAVKLNALDGPVWLAFHHEPEGDGDIKQWTAMQARLAPIVRSAASNVSYTIVVTGYHQLYGQAQYSLDSLWPKNTKVDMLGVDVYNKYGVVKDGKEYTTHTDLEGDYFSKFAAWANPKGIAWGVAETGFTDKAAVVNPQWVQNSYNLLKKYNGVAFTYFNTTLNSIANWALSTETKKQVFTAALRTTPTI